MEDVKKRILVRPPAPPPVGPGAWALEQREAGSVTVRICMWVVALSGPGPRKTLVLWGRPRGATW